MLSGIESMIDWATRSAQRQRSEPQIEPAAVRKSADSALCGLNNMHIWPSPQAVSPAPRTACVHHGMGTPGALPGNEAWIPRSTR